MDETNPQQQNAVRSVRFVHRFLMLMVPLYAFVAEQFHPASGPLPPERTILLGIGASAVSQVLVAAFIRQKIVLGSEAALRNVPLDAAVLKRWLTGNVTVYVFCESVALHGFALRFLGHSFAQCLPFYAMAIFLFLRWRPQGGPSGLN